MKREDYLMYKQWVNTTIIQLHKMSYALHLPTTLWRYTNRDIDKITQRLTDMLEGASRMYHDAEEVN